MKRSHDQDDRSSQPVNREEREMDDQYRDMVTQRQVINNQRQRVLSLQDLTLNFVVEIVKQCAHNKQDPRPLDEYPGPLLDLVFGKLTKRDKYHNTMMIHFDIVKQMITQRSRQVEFTLRHNGDFHYEPPWSVWSHEKVQSVLALLDKCKNQLTTLEIRVYIGLTEAARPSLPQIHELVSHQANLTELGLTCDINDQTLAIISATCHNLRHLEIHGNKAVTDAGLQYLSKGPEGKLSNITFLGVYGTSVTASGIAKFMLELRDQLECVEVQEPEKTEALVELCQISPPVQFPKYNSLSNCQEGNPYFAKIVSMLPNVSLIELFFCPDVTPLLALTKVTKLKLWSDPHGQNYNLISEKLIPQWSSYLTRVNLRNDSGSDMEIDFSVFAQCENLEMLELFGFNLKVESSHELLPTSFSKLSYCKVDGKIPDTIVTKMLTSPCLETCSVRLVPDHVIRSVISEARTNPQIFSKLKLLELYFTTQFTVDTWIQLLCVLPDNVEMLIRNIRDTYPIISLKLLSKLRLFARRNNIIVRILFIII